MGIRRLECDDEAKFWEAWIKDELIFCYRYGKLGSAGHTKLKKFKTAAEAQAELEEKLEEKLAEGFSEVGANAGEGREDKEEEEVEEEGEAASETPHAESPSPVPEEIRIGARFALRTASTGEIEAARQALLRLAALSARAGARSWQVAHAARKARKALACIGGIDPATHPELGAAFDGVMGLVSAREKRLPLELALGLLWELDASVFERTARHWKEATAPSPASSALAVLTALLGALDPETALHVGAALVERRLPPAAWRRRFEKVKPYFMASLGKKGRRLDVFLDALSSQSGSDPIVQERVRCAREMAA